MDEILKQLVNNELLSESTRTQITEQWQQATTQLKKQLREEVEQDVRAEFASTWVKEREQLIDKLDAFLGESLKRELSELKTDVERFRDHEVSQAQKIVEMRTEMAKTLAGEMDSLVDKVDSFLEQRIASELDELREDIEIARQNQLGNKIFEAFRTTYETSFVDSQSVQAKLNIAESQLRKAKNDALRLAAEKEQMLRESKMQEILRPLNGTAREQMSLILQSVKTADLAESYKRFVGRVLRDNTAPAGVMTESYQAPATVLKTGNSNAEATAPQKPQTELSESLRQLQRVAGIIR